MTDRRGSIFLYAIFISFFAAVMGYIVVVKMDILSGNLALQNYDTVLHAHITEKANLAFGYDISRNSNSGTSNGGNDDFVSTGATDDDDIGRKTLYGYVKKKTGWSNVFSVNTPLRAFIAGNVFNSGGYGEAIGTTSTGYIRLDIDNPYSIKVAEFDKKAFDQTKELAFVTGSEATFATGAIGWLLPDLSLSSTAGTGARKTFDFQNRDYALFLAFSGNATNSWINFLKYQITVQNQQGSGVYIVPINDTGSEMNYRGFDIVIDREKNYRYKQFDVVQKNPLR